MLSCVIAVACSRESDLTRTLKVSMLASDGGLSPTKAAEHGEPGYRAVAEALRDWPEERPVPVSFLDACKEPRPEAVSMAPVLAEALADTRRPVDVRKAALFCLEELRQAALPWKKAVRPVLHDASAELRDGAVRALVAMGDEAVVPVLASMLQSEHEAFTAVFLLAHPKGLGPKARAAVPALASGLRTAAFDIRPVYADALGAIGGPEAVAALRDALDGPAWRTAEAAAFALERLGAREAIPALKRVAQVHWLGRMRTTASSVAESLEGMRSTPTREQGEELRELRRKQWRTLESRERERCTKRSSRAWRLDFGGRTLILRAPDGARSSNEAALPRELLETLRARYPDEAGQRFVPVEGGWMVARHCGEFGGELLFMSRDGSVQSVLEEQAVLDVVRVGGALVALGGIDHLSANDGWTYRVSRTPTGAWTATPLAELPGTPVYWEPSTDGTLLVITRGAAAALSPDGTLREIACRPLG